MFRMRQNVFDLVRAEEPHGLPLQREEVPLHVLRVGLPREAAPRPTSEKGSFRHQKLFL